MHQKKRILLVITGGIAAYKTPELVRRLKERSFDVRCVLSKGGRNFVAPLALAAVSGDQVYEDLFDLTSEAEMGHIELSRSADLVLVAPATANIMAKAAGGLADDLASTILLATDKDVMMAPAMNVRMWEHGATQANLKTLQQRGIKMIGPDEGDMACGEFGYGRMSDPVVIVDAVEQYFAKSQALAGKKIIVTSGPTHEAIDPVRYIANRSSGKQGHAIAKALADQGAAVTLVSGPTQLDDPQGLQTVHIESARDMLSAVQEALPADGVVCCAAVADWRVHQEAGQKLKKDGTGLIEDLKLTENPDILATISKMNGQRPKLVVGFAAETENLVQHAQDKRARKECDWIVANDVSQENEIFGGDNNLVHLIGESSCEEWPLMSKTQVAARLSEKIATFFTELEKS